MRAAVEASRAHITRFDQACEAMRRPEAGAIRGKPCISVVSARLASAHTPAPTRTHDV